MSQPTNLSSRLGFIDWTRGLAAVIMLQGHVFHSFTRTDLRNSDGYILSQFIGGMPPAIFLFLTGVTFAFLMDRSERNGLATGARIFAALRRAGYLFALAALFRLQLWIFAWGQSPWTDLFRVDILNCMGLALAAFSLMAAFQTVERVRLCAILGIAIAAAAPLMSQMPWADAPDVLRRYLAPDYAGFNFFPWAAFVAFGMSAGSLVRLTEAAKLDRIMQWSALAGLGLIVGAHYFSNIPYSLYARSEFWLDSPALVLIKLGIILLMLTAAYLWNLQAGTGWSWLKQLGTTSLLIYWVHTEIVYGRWLGYWKDRLSLGEGAVAAAAVILAMLGISVMRSLWERWRRTPRRVPAPAVEYSRYSGD